MKNIFSEYYPIKKEVINEIWDKGVFCYDANVLLNLYRYSHDTRNKILENIEYFIKKTIIPYQACYEYLKNKRTVEDNLLGSYDKIIDIINKMTQSLETGELAGYRKHCALDIDKDIIKPIKASTTKIINKLNSTKVNHSSYLNASEIHEKISQLFEGKISEKFSEEELKKIYNEGKGRYEKKIPPGFADYQQKKNGEENSLYGDLIIWKHLIEIAKNKNTDVIFITDDRKKDWWDIHQGQIKGALPELYREFKEFTSHTILIYSVEDFMKYAPEHSEIAVPKKVINEIEELRKVDEKRTNYLDLDSFYNLNTIEQFNKQNSIWEYLNKQNEILKTLNIQTKFADYSKSIEELNKITQKTKFDSSYFEWLDNLKKATTNTNLKNMLDLHKKLSGRVSNENEQESGTE